MDRKTVVSKRLRNLHRNTHPDSSLAGMPLRKFARAIASAQGNSPLTLLARTWLKNKGVRP